MGKTFQKKTKMSLREAELFIRNGGNAAEFVDKNTALSNEERQELWDAALSLKESRDYIKGFKEKYGMENGIAMKILKQHLMIVLKKMGI